MTNKIWKIVLVLSVVIFLLAGVLLNSFVQRETLMVTSQIEELLQERLVAEARAIDGYVKDMESLVSSYLDSPLDKAEVRRILRKNGLLSQIFYLDKEGELVYPSMKDLDLSKKEKDFLMRIRDVVESGVLLTSNDYEVTKLKTFYSTSQRKWHSFFHNSGINLVLYEKIKNGIVCVEIDRSRFFADLIVYLSNQSTSKLNLDDGYIQILDSQQRVLYKWGALNRSKSDKVEFSASRNLLSPLASWKIEYKVFSDSRLSSLARNRTNGLVSALVGVLATIFGLIFYLYRENKKNIEDVKKK